MFDIQYHEAVVKEDIPRLSPEWKKKIKKTIEDKLFEYPEIFGKPLRNSLKSRRKLRVGDYRVVFDIKNRQKIVRIFIIQHRSLVYKEAERRFFEC